MGVFARIVRKITRPSVKLSLAFLKVDILVLHVKRHIHKSVLNSSVDVYSAIRPRPKNRPNRRLYSAVFGHPDGIADWKISDTLANNRIPIRCPPEQNYSLMQVVPERWHSLLASRVTRSKTPMLPCNLQPHLAY